MHFCEPRLTPDRRILWISAFAVALWLFLVSPGTAIAGGEHQSSGWDSPSDHGSGDWQNGSEKSPPEYKPPEETPPVEKPPVEKPPVEKPPVETPPVETPPVEKPPVETPPVETPPVETPPVETETPPVETPPEKPNRQTTTPETPNTRVERGSGGVLGQEQSSGGGGVVQASPAQSSLPFTGSETPLLILLGASLLGIGLVLHRMSVERG
jgi:outer membrane biosynthesis protein TonB